MEKFVSSHPRPNPEQKLAASHLIDELLSMARTSTFGFYYKDDRRAEIATILVEECAEAVQRATKLLRFGVDEVQTRQPHTNAERLGFEIGDVLVMLDEARPLTIFYDDSHLIRAIEQAEKAGIITRAAVQLGKVTKRKNLEIYLQT